MNDNLKHYLFRDLETGEEFIVGDFSLEEAEMDALEYFEDPVFICEISEIEAEMSGLDEY